MKGLKIAAILAVVVSALAAGVIALALFVFSGTDEAEARANLFLEHVREARIAIAYESASPAFRAQRGLDGFVATVEDSGLTRAGPPRWGRRRTDGSTVTLFGRAELPSGEEIAIRLAVRREDVWRVTALAVGDDTDAESVAGRDGGHESETEFESADLLEGAARDRLVMDTLLAFNDAVQRSDFSDFHQRLAAPFREQHQPADIQGAFQAFIDNGVDISEIRDSEPVYSGGAELLEDGRMTLAGHFPTEPSRLNFELTYVREEDDWRLFRIRVVVEPSSN